MILIEHPCKNVKEISDTLEVTNESTNQVKESKNNLLVHKYELFNLKDTKDISKMLTRFIDVLNRLKALDRDMPNTKFGEQDPMLTPKELGTKGDRHFGRQGSY